MKIIVFLVIISSLSFIYFISLEHQVKDEKEKKNMPKVLNVQENKIDSMPLEELRDMFLKLDIHSKEIDLDRRIKDIKKARKRFPLDDKLKMVDMELENRRANERAKNKI